VLDFLRYLINTYLMITGRGELFSTSMLMHLPTRPSGRMPDIFVVLAEHRDRVLKQWHEGAADFGLEVLSESSTTRDLSEKRHEFETAGLPEYVVADGRERGDTFLCRRLDPNRSYFLVEPDAQGRYHSEVLPGFWLDPAWLRKEPFPNPLLLIRQIVPDAWQRFIGDAGPVVPEGPNGVGDS
jgi:Uma2 family endonuclease